MIRVLLDVNVLVSYLINPDAQKTVTRVVDWVLSSNCQWIVPQELIDELLHSCRTKPYLQERIPPKEVDAFVKVSKKYGVIPSPLPTLPTSFSRDPKDDYLLAYALVERVDYLVTGDKDLLVLGQIGWMSIVTPAQFLERI
jgi:hypothetical protein